MKNFLLLPALALILLATGILSAGCEKSVPSVHRPGKNPHPGQDEGDAGTRLTGDWKLFFVYNGGMVPVIPIRCI